MNISNQDVIPSELRDLPQWVCWRYEDRDGKPTKPPINPKSNGKLLYAKSNDPATWSDFDTACAAATRLKLEGVGLNLSESDNLTGLDLDHVLDPETLELDPLAVEVLARFAGTYTEVSPSGAGLRIWCYGKAARSGKCEGSRKWLEVYTHPSNRYLTVTGNRYGAATAVTEQQEALDWLHSRFMESSRSKEASTGREIDLLSSPVGTDLSDDAALLNKASQAKNGSAFDALWSGDLSGHTGDHSAADMALLNALAFWTGNDAARMDRLFRQSGLMRPKWDDMHGTTTYGDASISKAISGCRNVYTGLQPQKTVSNDPVLVRYDKRGNPSLVAHSIAADLLYASEFHSRLYYDPVVCNWLQYQESGVFKLCPDLMIQQSVYNAIEKYTGDLGFQSAYVSGVSSCLRHKAIKQPKKPSGLICFNNGVLDLSTRQLLPHSPDYFFTNQLPFDWIPDAPDPTLIIDWLREATGGHDDQVELIRAWFHAVIVGRPDLQRFLEVMGFGGSGKGTLLRLLCAVVGNEAIHSTKIEHLENNRFETAKIFNKKLVVVTDAEKWHGDVSVLKSITGQDPIRFEEKNKQSGDSFTFGGMVLILANQHTASNDYSSGIQRRKITVAFDHVVPAEKRRDLDSEFEPLLPNLIRWALDMPESEVTAYLRTTSSRVKSLQAIRLENLEATNPIVAWLRSNCKFDPTATTQIGAKRKITITTGEFSRETRTEFEHSATRLYPNYCQWCEQTGKQPISLNTFSRTVIDASQNMLGKLFVKSARQGGTGKTLISGLTLRPCEDNCEPYLIDCEECEDREELKKVSENREGKNAPHPVPVNEVSANLGRSEEVPRVLHVVNNQGVSPHKGLHSASHVKAEPEDVKHSTPVAPALDRLDARIAELIDSGWEHSNAVARAREDLARMAEVAL